MAEEDLIRIKIIHHDNFPTDGNSVSWGESPFLTQCEGTVWISSCPGHRLENLVALVFPVRQAGLPAEQEGTRGWRRGEQGCSGHCGGLREG